MSERIPVVFDTDIGTDVDDALALLLALSSPELDVIGVTTVDGDTGLRARLAARLLGLAGRPDIPVIIGASTPLGIGRMPLWFGHEGQGVLDEPWDGVDAPILDAPADAWLVETSRAVEYHLIAVGPFTNVARAVLLDGTFPGRVRHLSVMGGMAHADAYGPAWQAFFAETGLPPNHMDHNTASDVEAALIVARAGFEMTWVTAELTFGTSLARSAMAAFAATGVPLGMGLAEMLRIWSSRYLHVIPRFPETARPFPEDAVAALHDPLTVASVVGVPWLHLRPHRLRFDQEGDLFAMHEVDHGGEAVHQVSVGVDATALSAFVTERISALIAGPDRTDWAPEPMGGKEEVEI